jgi:hypothetical protein
MGFLVGSIAGAVGGGYFLYGKKQARPAPMICGVLLMAYPYFLENLWLTLGVASCCARFRCTTGTDSWC